MIHSLNITAPPTTEGEYTVLSLNRYPVVIVDVCDASELVHQQDVIDIVRKYVKSRRIHDNGHVVVRSINERDYSIVDSEFKISDIYSYGSNV